MNNDSCEVSSNPSFFDGTKQNFQSLSSLSKVCKICLKKIETVNSYCRCSSITPKHEQCLLGWAKTSETKNQFGESFVTCDVCKENIYLKTKRKCRLANLNSLLRCRSCVEGQSKYERIGLVILFIVIAVVFCVMLQRYINKASQTYLILTIVFGAAELLFMMCFCFRRIVTTQQVIVGLYERQIYKHINRKIMPS